MMRYLSNSMVIEASVGDRGARVLESLGYKSENELDRETRKARNLESLKAFKIRKAEEQKKMNEDLFQC